MKRNPCFLTATEEHDLVIRAQAGDLAARDRVIAGITPLVFQKANRIAIKYPPADPADLAQQALLKIVAKFHKFNPSLGFRFSSYFGRCIDGDMVALAKQNGIVKSLRQTASLKKSSQAAQKRHSGALCSLDRNMSARDDGIIVTFADLVIDHREASASAAQEREALALAVRECVARVPDRWRQIIDWHFCDGKTFVEIGELVGLTRARVQQIVVQALRWVRDILLRKSIIREFVAERGDNRTAADCTKPPKRKPKSLPAKAG